MFTVPFLFYIFLTIGRACDTYYVCDDSLCSTPTCVTDYATNIVEDDARPLWMIMCGAQVFFMQLGFLTLEAGSVSRRNVQNILFKGLMDACLGTLVWFCFGYGVAWGKGESGGFFGGNSFFTVGYDDTPDWFFQWAFCVTASTIVSGAVAERMKLEAYFVYVFSITALTYPVVVRWVWSEQGWASALNTEATSPIVDFAGSSVVHMVGGFSGLMGALIVGPRAGRFEKDDSIYKTHSIPFQAFGTIMLWFGWYGFNCGSTVAVAGAMETASLVAVTTTLAAASGGVTAVCMGKFATGKWSIGLMCNGILAGLVSVTAPCAVIHSETSVLIGIVGGMVYYGFSRLMIRLKIDDPIDAAAVHGAGGFWGTVCVGLFATDEYLIMAGYTNEAEFSVAKRFANQLGLAIAVTVWTLVTTGLMFYITDIIIGLRDDHGATEEGLDVHDFGVEAYEKEDFYTTMSFITPEPEIETTAPERARVVDLEQRHDEL